MNLGRWLFVAAAFGVLTVAACACDGCEAEYPDEEAIPYETEAPRHIVVRFDEQPREFIFRYGQSAPVRVLAASTAEQMGAQFDAEYRDILENEQKLVACARRRLKRDELWQEGCAEEMAREALRDLEELVANHPDREPMLRPDLARFRKARLAEIKAEFAEVGYDLTVDYGARHAARVACWRRIPRGSSGREYEHRIRQCGNNDEFRCTFEPEFLLAQYLELLHATRAPAATVRTASLAYARVLEDPSEFHCEGTVHHEYERAHAIYTQLGRKQDVRRAARGRAIELLEQVCHEAWTNYDCDGCGPNYETQEYVTEVVPAQCDYSRIEEATQWFTKAAVQPNWREEYLGLSKVAQDFDLPCEAIDFAERAGDVERVRVLTLSHGSQCANWKSFRSGSE